MVAFGKSMLDISGKVYLLFSSSCLECGSGGKEVTCESHTLKMERQKEIWELGPRFHVSFSAWGSVRRLL